MSSKCIEKYVDKNINGLSIQTLSYIYSCIYKRMKIFQKHFVQAVFFQKSNNDFFYGLV